MEGGALVMSQRERSRLVMMARVREKAMTIKEASEMVGGKLPAMPSDIQAI